MRSGGLVDVITTAVAIGHKLKIGTGNAGSTLLSKSLVDGAFPSSAMVRRPALPGDYIIYIVQYLERLR